MKILLAIGAGSFIGGVGRYLLSQFIQTKNLTQFPVGTLVVNIVGCFLIGLVFGFAAKGNLSEEWRLFLATGILGGFTTFSAFSLESVYMLQTEQYGQAILYILASVLLGLLATFAGMWLVKLA
ncbi:fluoride efflux transporter CrcB [Pontibacter sp. HSC-14F20]|uniref:fluoride efflux transporter CrcB n=1 Tax=Pontibacter sp. HSC-14F20 TaxID=2864136 RepID=UPI001C732FCB|nr:fluoride efflux transporter CrcB [Pontibacter sp. HSC-14F20]MBX0333054.1 fluoride efflux transporter CrcB [Pontibacter sp. HSC-14F20]